MPRLQITQQIRLSVIEKLSQRFGLKCWYCGVGLTNRQIHIDHIKPLDHQGADRIDNMALACAPCNRAKWNMPLEDFFAWVKRIRWLEDFPAKDAFGSAVIDVGDESGDTSPDAAGADLQH